MRLSLLYFRPTVFINVNRRPPSTGGDFTVEESYTACLDPLLTELSEKEALFPRTIVYLPIKWCGFAHEHAIGFLKQCAGFIPRLAEGDQEVKSYVAQYHSGQTAEESIS